MVLAVVNCCFHQKEIMERIPFLPQKVKAVFKDISLVEVLWQNRGTAVF
jgi:hypothetical protein